MAEKFDVVVIGGGAAGMMAAGRAAERGRRVLLVEKNPVLGKKLSITGGGRCNVTNAEDDVRLLLSHYGEAAKFLFSSFSQFGVAETFSFFTNRGLPLVVQAKQRAFPTTERATDVVKTLVDYLKSGQVEVRTKIGVEEIIVESGNVTGLKIGQNLISAESYILATGGQSHPATGSTGDGWEWLRDLGLDVHQPTPAVVPLAVADEWIQSLAGTSFNEAKITFWLDGKKELMKTGRILCTHFGLSGPLILNLAKKVADLLEAGEVTATIDVVPKMDLGALDQHITKIFDQNKNRDLKNVMKIIAPTGTAPAILTLLPTINQNTKVHSISKTDRKLIGQTLKALPVAVTGLMGFDRAVVVDGGVALTEVENSTMRVRKIPNLFVTGDLLHINRPSGGYSLQLCWTTGWVAGNAA